MRRFFYRFLKSITAAAFFLLAVSPLSAATDSVVIHLYAKVHPRTFLHVGSDRKPVFSIEHDAYPTMIEAREDGYILSVIAS
ncbi:MAG: hypothetical protein IJ831_01050 [Spirochaetales bacterium]|nr:hypothetical protein [Spirochaetales bacterium]